MGCKRTIILSAGAALLFLLLWYTTLWGSREDVERKNVRILIMGDSLVADCRDETSVPAVLSRLLGEQVFNGTLGGTYFTMGSGAKKDNYNMDLLSMRSLMNAIMADDFGVQRTFRGRQPATEYFSDTLDELAGIDYGSVEVLILEYGINDYHVAFPIDNGDDPMDDTTYAGAIRKTVTDLKKAYPNMRVIMVTPTYAWYVESQMTCEEYDTGNGYLEDYVNALIDAARDAGAEVIDLYHGVYEHDTWEDWRVYTWDGIHPNEYGRRMIAERMAEGLRVD